MAPVKTSLMMVAVVTMVMISRAAGVWIKLPKTGTKCVSEEINAHVVVLGEYSGFYEEHFDANPTISGKVDRKDQTRQLIHFSLCYLVYNNFMGDIDWNYQLIDLLFRSCLE